MTNKEKHFVFTFTAKGCSCN